MSPFHFCLFYTFPVFLYYVPQKTFDTKDRRPQLDCSSVLLGSQIPVLVSPGGKCRGSPLSSCHTLPHEWLRNIAALLHHLCIPPMGSEPRTELVGNDSPPFFGPYSSLVTHNESGSAGDITIIPHGGEQNRYIYISRLYRPQNSMHCHHRPLKHCALCLESNNKNPLGLLNGRKQLTTSQRVFV